MTCKDCIYYEVCPLGLAIKAKTGICLKFKNKADFVQVVRCKDCKFRKTNDCAMYYECDCGSQEDWENNNDFCSYGQRSDT